ncbi:MAG: 1-acyl-sn-glycerol-3-phosphate acyltransferase [Clostridium sp.]|nr:1-acyl-sn-glycerol-3-phosphate acyltransferase [Prevotella sp.]MCM1429129.1 1-acyl-sn-glycerol-3-phosphate acyltransferase [Clostridium sp.]MCM1475343.1 1-acyl-sn-glycerol-3-phosphate acyltransferase [Muribaculaceae bacterium]
MEKESQLIQIDLHKILRKRLGGWKGKLIPGFLISLLERVVCQDELNVILRACYPAEGSDFAKRVLAHLNISVEVEGLDELPDGRFVFASNHPLGGLDGITLVAVLGARYGDDNLRVLVNDMLMNVRPLADVFLPVNKYGAQGRRSAELINEAFQSDAQIVTFPAGLVSRLHDDGSIRDLMWQKAFAAKALSSNRDIVPVRFEALNSLRFYKFARWRKKSGLKINIEQALLPSELVKCRGKRFRIHFGSPLSIASMKEQGLSAREITMRVRGAADKL